MPNEPDHVRRRGRPHGLFNQGRRRSRRERPHDAATEDVSFLDPDEMADVKRQRKLNVSIRTEDTPEVVG